MAVMATYIPQDRLGLLIGVAVLAVIGITLIALAQGFFSEWQQPP
jgi:hypothetical protein